MGDVLHRTEKTYLQSVNTPDYSEVDWILNPDISAVAGVNNRYWKIVGDVVSEMSQAEKDAIDNDIKTLDTKGLLGKDYKYIRNRIILSVINAGGFANLDTEEKEIVVRWFAVSKTDRDTIYTTDQQIQFGLYFHSKSVESRQLRFSSAMMEIYNRLSSSETNEVISDLIPNNLDSNYTNFGEEGTVEGDLEGLFDYIEARTGTSFENTGFAAKTYAPDGMTLNDLVIKIMDILKNGIY